MGEKVDAIIQVKRGTEPQRLGVQFREGELAYSTDVKRLYIGDGTTLGGIAASSKLYYGNPSGLGTTISGLVPGDYFLDTTATLAPKLYALTGTNVGNLSSYTLICDNNPSVLAYSIVNANSAFWGQQGGIALAGAFTALQSGSANWNASYSTVYSNSASWNLGGTASLGSLIINSIVATNSANWNSSSTTVANNSAKWVLHDGIKNDNFFFPYTVGTTNEYLKIDINGTIRYIRLWDAIP
jgi:hypothetical protein